MASIPTPVLDGRYGTGVRAQVLVVQGVVGGQLGLGFNALLRAQGLQKP